MKCTTIIDKTKEEEILIILNEPNEISEKIFSLVNGDRKDLYGFKNDEAIKIEYRNLFCIYVEDNKVFANFNGTRLNIKDRLYRVEDILPNNFVRINQSCIINIDKIERFTSSFSGTLCVKLKDGYTDYVSRRQLKKVKEKVGI